VLKASGHVERFNDFVVKDSKNEDKFWRADKLLEEVMEKRIADAKTPEEKKEFQQVFNAADSYSKEDLIGIFEKYQIFAPESGNRLTDPVDFNLMFATPVGPTGKETGYLRPETAQGIFLNYKWCKEQNSDRMPMGIAQIGKVR
jgi:glycyl-tRNA synthetase